MGSSLYFIKLKFWRKVSVVYGVWWDVINTAVGVLLIVCLFLWFAMVLLEGDTSSLPFQDLIWDNFNNIVDHPRRTEMGLTIMGITVSGGSGAALVLIQKGTKRWAMNRRIGDLHDFFGRRLFNLGLAAQPSKSEIDRDLMAYQHAIVSFHEDVCLHHRDFQKAFDELKALSYLYVEQKWHDHAVFCDIKRHMFFLVLMAKTDLRLPVDANCRADQEIDDVRRGNKVNWTLIEQPGN